MQNVFNRTKNFTVIFCVFVYLLISISVRRNAPLSRHLHILHSINHEIKIVHIKISIFYKMSKVQEPLMTLLRRANAL